MLASMSTCKKQLYINHIKANHEQTTVKWND